MVIQQGDVVWVDLPSPRGSEPAGRRPAVVLQHDRFNASSLNTIVLVMVTSNMRLRALPGNVALRRGEAGLPKPSVVNVTQLATVDRGDVVGKVGRISSGRLEQVWDGVRLVIEPARIARS